MKLHEWGRPSELYSTSLNSRLPEVPVAFAPDGSRFAITTQAGFGIWATEPGQCLAMPLTKDFLVEAVVYSPDGKYIVVVEKPSPEASVPVGDPRVRLLKADDGKIEAELGAFSRPTFGRSRIAFSAGSDRLAITDEDGIRVHRVPSGTIILRPKFRPDTRICAFSPDLKVVAVANPSLPKLTFFEIANGKTIREFAWPGTSAGAIAYSPDGRWLATGSGDTSILLWDLKAHP